MKKKKRVRFNDEEEREADPVGSEEADTTMAQGGGPVGAAAPSHKRKRNVNDEGGKGMNIDTISVVESLGGVLSRISTVDPGLEHWAKTINEDASRSGVTHGDAAVGRRGKELHSRSPPTDVADGNIGEGTTKQMNKVDVMEMYSPLRVTIEANKFGLTAGQAMGLIT